MTCGEIYWIDFGLPVGSEPGFRRPALVIQSDSLNQSDFGTTLIIPFTTNLRLADYKGNVLVEKKDSGLSKDSVALCSQIMVVDKRRLTEKTGKVSASVIDEVVDEILSVIGNRI